MPWLTKDPDVVWTDLEDGGILLHLRTKRYYSLNAVGQSIWKLLDDAETPSDLIRGLMTEYAVDATRARESVARFLLELDRARLLQPHPPTPLAAQAPGDAGAGSSVAPAAGRRSFGEPEVRMHDEPLHDVVMNPFDPQQPLAE